MGILEGRLEALVLEELVPRRFAPDPASELWGRRLSLAVACGTGTGPRGDRPPIHQIVAPSGSGKTTLARLLSGEGRLGSGAVRLAGLAPSGRRRVAASPSGESTDLLRLSGRARADWLARHAAFIPQDLRVVGWLTPRANLDLAPERLPDAGVLAEAFADRLELDLARRVPAATLSRGEQQRLALVRALLRPARVIVADEAFSHLDRRLQRIAAGLLAERAAATGTALVLLDLEPNPDVPADSLIHLRRPAGEVF